MALFHFSDDPAIACFTPRPVVIPSQRPPGMDWLNGPLVWAIDEARQPMYLFPRDCPRILLWPRAETTPADRARWIGDSPARVVVFIERAWAERYAQAVIHRYALPDDSFESLDDAGMWVSRVTVTPLARETLEDLPAQLRAQGGELRLVDDLAPLKAAYGSSLSYNGIRMRNAQAPGQPLNTVER